MGPAGLHVLLLRFMMNDEARDASTDVDIKDGGVLDIHVAAIAVLGTIGALALVPCCMLRRSTPSRLMTALWRRSHQAMLGAPGRGGRYIDSVQEAAQVGSWQGKKDLFSCEGRFPQENEELDRQIFDRFLVPINRRQLSGLRRLPDRSNTS